MATYIYNGEGDREFPTLVLTLKSGDTFEAPDGFEASDVSLSNKKQGAPASVPSTPSAATDSTAGA